MRDYANVLARAQAREQGRAIVMRENTALAPDPPAVFGIAPVKVVAEEIVQAIAYGRIGEEPRTVVRGTRSLGSRGSWSHLPAPLTRT